MSASGVHRPPRAPEIVRLRRETRLSAKSIAAQVGVHVSYVWSVLRRARIAAGERVKRGETPVTIDADEYPLQARARVHRELTAGKRCPRCWLLLPCDHAD